MARNKIRGEQIKDDSITGADIDESTLGPSIMSGSVSGGYITQVLNGEGSSGHGLLIRSYGNGSSTYLLDVTARDGKTVLRADGDGHVGIGNHGNSLPAALSVKQYSSSPIVNVKDSSDNAILKIDGDAKVMIADNLYHSGDLDTYVGFPGTNEVNLVAGGSSFLKYDGNILINNANANVDMKVMADDGNVILMTDASTNRTGIGITTPQSTLHVHADSIDNGTVTISQSDNSGDASQLDISKSRGTGASPSDVQSGDFVGQVRFLGYEGSSYQNFADIYAQTAGTIDAANHPTKIVIRTTPLGGTSPVSAVTIDESQNITAAGGVYGKMRHMTHHRYSDTSLSGKEYIPFAGSTAEQASPSSITQGIAPYSGRLVAVWVRSSKSGGLGNTSVALHMGVNGDTVVSTTAEETVEVAMNQQNTSYAFNFTASTHFAAGDVIGVAVDPTNIHGNVNVTCIWEYVVTA